ncbi:MAG: hypothetical protein K8R67_07545 [Desulfobacteraceae bacterium]|nr:hypothetical protein [Desulfobacteraceae bacterium]
MPFTDPSFAVNLTNIRWIAGPLFILWGSYVLFKSIKSKPYKEYNLKCPHCGKVSILNHLEEHKCNKCGGHLEELKGFFERHPEFKEKS